MLHEPVLICFWISSQLPSDTAARPFSFLCGIRQHQFVSCKYPTLSQRLALTKLPWGQEMRNSSSTCRIKKKKKENLTFKRSRKQHVHNKSPASKCSKEEKVDINRGGIFLSAEKIIQWMWNWQPWRPSSLRIRVPQT